LFAKRKYPWPLSGTDAAAQGPVLAKMHKAVYKNINPDFFIPNLLF
jgi:hypothetical protein